VEVTRKPGVRYRKAVFLPEGSSLLGLSDESGELELWKLPANGVGSGEQLSQDGSVLRWESVPSPDGKWIAHHDKNQQLWVLSVEKKSSVLVAKGQTGDFQDLTWSPDSKWLACVWPAANGFNRVFVYPIGGGESTALSSDRFDSWSPVFTPDGGVALLPVGPQLEVAGVRTLGVASARSLPRQSHRAVRGFAQEGLPLAVRAGGRAAS
jgi:tricorn protease